MSSCLLCSILFGKMKQKLQLNQLQLLRYTLPWQCMHRIRDCSPVNVKVKKFVLYGVHFQAKGKTAKRGYQPSSRMKFKWSSVKMYG